MPNLIERLANVNKGCRAETFVVKVLVDLVSEKRVRK